MKNYFFKEMRRTWEMDIDWCVFLCALRSHPPITGGVAASLHPVARTEDEDAAQRQPAHFQATRRSQIYPPALLFAGTLQLRI